MATNDSEELEALFDSIAAGSATAQKKQEDSVPKPAPIKPGGSSLGGIGDSDDLQALFDSVSAETAQKTEGGVSQSITDLGAESQSWPGQEAVFNRIGHMARELHDTIRELGYDKLIEETVSALPDAKDRLAYVANLTEQAACRVLNATDIACPIIDGLENSSKALGERWNLLYQNKLSVQEFKSLASDTRSFLNDGLPEKTHATHAQLTEIMMAQDFQDLTGQVIKKIVSLAQSLENGLMAVLLDVVPDARKTEEVTSLMNGPVINAEGRVDVVVNQQQVDDLLDSLGF